MSSDIDNNLFSELEPKKSEPITIDKSGSDTPIIDGIAPRGDNGGIKLTGDWLNPQKQIDSSLRGMVEDGLTDPNNIYDNLFKDKYKINRDQARRDAIKARSRIDAIPVTSYSALAKGVTKGASDMQLTDPVTIIDKTLNGMDSSQLAAYLNRVVNKRNPVNSDERSKFLNEEYKRLTDTIYGRVAEDYQDEFKPSSDSEFILGSAMKDNILANIASGMGRGISGASTFSDAARDVSYGDYSEKDAGIFDNIIASVATIAADTPAFIGASGVGALANKGALQNIGRYLVTKNVGTHALKRIPKAYLERIGAYAVDNTLWGGVVAEGARGAATLGSYEMLGESANQYKYKEFDPKEIAHKGIKGGLIGGAIGGVHGELYNARVLKAKPAKVSLRERAFKTGVESSIFSMGEAIDQDTFFSDETLTSDPELLRRNINIVGRSIGMIGVMSLLRNAPKMIKQRYNTHATDLRFTPQEMNLIRKQGMTASDKSLVNRVVAMDYKNPISSESKTVNGGNGDFEQFATENSEILAGEYKDFIGNSNIPISARAKMMYIIEGLTVPIPLVTGSKMDKVVNEESGKVEWVVDALSLDGSIIERIAFDSESKAKTRNLENTHIGQINTEKELNHEIYNLQYNTVLREAYNDAINNNMFSGTFEEFVKKDKFLFKEGDFNSLSDEIKYERGKFGRIIGDRIRANEGKWRNVKTEIKNYYSVWSVDELLAKPIEARSKRENDIVDYYLSELRKEYLKLNDPVRESLVEQVPDVPMPTITNPNLISRPRYINPETGMETRHTPESYAVINSSDFKQWYGDWSVGNKEVRNRLFYRPKRSNWRNFLPTKTEQGLMANISYAPIRNMEQGLMINLDMGKVLENNPHKSGVKALDMKVAMDNMGWILSNAKHVRDVADSNQSVYYSAALIGGKQYSVRFIVNNGMDGSHTLEYMNLYDFREERMNLFKDNMYQRKIADDLYGIQYRQSDNDRDRIPDFLLDMGAGVLDPRLKLKQLVPRSNVEDFEAVNTYMGHELYGEPDPIFVKLFQDGYESPLKDVNNTIYFTSPRKMIKNYLWYENKIKEDYIRQIYKQKAQKELQEKREKTTDKELDEKKRDWGAEIKKILGTGSSKLDM